jgi:hypothetical protein
MIAVAEPLLWFHPGAARFQSSLPNVGSFVWTMALSKLRLTNSCALADKATPAASVHSKDRILMDFITGRLS